MKKLILTLTTVAGLAMLGLAGCSKSGSDAEVIDTSKLQSTFSAVAAVDKAEVEKAIGAIKSGDFASAVTSLKQAAANVKLTPEQQQAIKDMLAQVQAKLGAAATEAADKTKTAAGDLQKATGK